MDYLSILMDYMSNTLLLTVRYGIIIKIVMYQ
jgi:hypothetical protein